MQIEVESFSCITFHKWRDLFVLNLIHVLKCVEFFLAVNVSSIVKVFLIENFKTFSARRKCLFYKIAYYTRIFRHSVDSVMSISCHT
jgi:hypothetical protein